MGKMAIWPVQCRGLDSHLLQAVPTKQHILDGKHSANFRHGVQVTIIMGGT